MAMLPRLTALPKRSWSIAVPCQHDCGGDRFVVTFLCLALDPNQIAELVTQGSRGSISEPRRFLPGVRSVPPRVALSGARGSPRRPAHHARLAQRAAGPGQFASP